MFWGYWELLGATPLCLHSRLTRAQRRFADFVGCVPLCVCVCVVFGGFTRGASARLSAKMCVYLDSIHLSYSGGQVPHRVCVCVCDADGILIKYSGVYVNLYAHMLSQDQPVWA